MRCFLALPLPEPVLARVALIQKGLRAACTAADVRWTRSETMHLTLHFLGEVAEARLDGLVRALGEEVARHRIARLALGGTGAFPSPRRARVVWLGTTDGAPELVGLAEALRRVLEPLGLVPDPKPFTPHVTLGRVRAPQRGADLRGALAAAQPSEAGAWTPEAVVLYQSRLGADGAVHEPLARLPLEEERCGKIQRGPW
ncbi:MAG TPA: RNA 2',3'-cyclic phosphodiesterase [Candidatus Limnocylindria bacterium]|nr:RNA 2',3'-cyclic phosphodiesterase [Candidatus Limnocylindria bacterium]